MSHLIVITMYLLCFLYWGYIHHDAALLNKQALIQSAFHSICNTISNNNNMIDSTLAVLQFKYYDGVMQYLKVLLVKSSNAKLA